jgi:hypothetical protein
MAANNYVKVVVDGYIRRIWPFDGDDPHDTDQSLGLARAYLRSLESRGTQARMVVWGAPLPDRFSGDPAIAPISSGRRHLFASPCRSPHESCSCAHFVGLSEDERRREHSLLALARDLVELAKEAS